MAHYRLYDDPNDERSTYQQIEVVLESDWMQDGACHLQPELNGLFYSYDNEEKKQAVAICNGCPVKSLCYAYAIVYNERGIWGGVLQSVREDRRPHIVEDVVELWPRLYGRWAGRAAERVDEPTPEPESPPAPVVRPLSEAEAARQRARDRAIGEFGELIRPFDDGAHGRRTKYSDEWEREDVG